jgi:elongation factor Ts
VSREPGAAEEQKRQALVQKLGENITIRRSTRLQAKGRIALYVHAGAKIGVLVDYEGPDEAGKDVAMHIAFARPAYLNKADVPQDIVSEERRILEARAKESGKPAEIAAKMAEGGLNKWLGERTLLGQPFIKDDKQTIEKMLASKKAKVNAYAFFVVGEGIEKKSTDFAAEVMAQAGKAH